MEKEFEAGNIMYKPDTITYNSVISAAANSFGDKKIKKMAFSIALNAFRKLHLSESDNIRPTSVTYTHFIKALRKLTRAGEARDGMLKRSFELGSKNGLINRYVLSQLKLACSPEVYQEIISQCGQNILDEECNIKGMIYDQRKSSYRP